jgi:WD40 repeat protein
MEVPAGWVMGVAFSPDGRQAVSCGRERNLRIWDVTTGKELRHFSTGDERPLQWHCVAFSPDGRFIVAGGGTYDARLFDAASGKRARRFGDHRGSVWAVAFSPDGKRLVMSSHHELRLWDVKGKSLRSIPVGSDWNSQAVFSPDGRCLLTSEMYTLILRKAETGKELRRWEGNRGNVTAAAFTLDGGRALSGSADGTVRLWDIETGKQLRLFKGHTELVSGIGVTRDGKRVLSVGRDQTIRLWELPK